MRIVCISDTHSKHSQLKIPDGDLLLHAGDATGRGGREEIGAFNAWLGSLPHRHKVIISGNHDFGFERNPEARSWITHAVYLQDEEVTIEGLRIYGSPWQPWFFNWAFNLKRGPELAAVWAKVPAGIDVLLTHSPPLGVLDRLDTGEPVGCEELTKALTRIRPKLHVFGHIHEAYGMVERDGIVYVNASSCNLKYRPVNPPVVVDL